MKGKLDKLKNSFAQYFLHSDKLDDLQLSEDKSVFNNTENLLNILGKTCLYLLQKTAQHMMGQIQDGKDPRDVWDLKSGFQLREIGHMHAIYQTYMLFLQKINKIEDQSLKKVLKKLAVFYGLYYVQQHASSIVEAEAVNGRHLEIIEGLYEEYLDILEKDALALIEAYSIGDSCLGSEIGHSNGKPYENL